MLGLFWVVVGGGRFILGGDRWQGVILGFSEWWWVVVDICWVVVSGGGFILGGGGCWWLVAGGTVYNRGKYFLEWEVKYVVCTNVYQSVYQCGNYKHFNHNSY